MEAAFLIRLATPPPPCEADAILRRDGGNFGGRKPLIQVRENTAFLRGYDHCIFLSFYSNIIKKNLNKMHQIEKYFLYCYYNNKKNIKSTENY